MSFSAAALLTSLQQHVPGDASGRLVVAFSGGLDSTVLLAALTEALAQTPDRLSAVHIDHGLHPDSRRWEAHCSRIALELGVHYVSKPVHVTRGGGEGTEAAARVARYAGLRDCMESGDVLLTAHHADDQLETLLLAVLRGAGLPGLSAMPVAQAFEPGWHVRPLLEFTRDELQDWATAQGLTWIEDPSNDRGEFSRNFLRSEVVPVLRSRWPSVASSALRSAGHAAEGAMLLEELAQTDLDRAAVGPCLSVAALKELSGPRRRNLLRYWTKRWGARPASTRKLLALEHDMLQAQDDRQPVIEWDGFEVRRFRGLLYADRARIAQDQSVCAYEWAWCQPFELPDGLGSLRTEAARGIGLARASLPATLRIEFRRGGELLQPAGAAHHRSLKKLLQDADILPWWRSSLPLLWVDDRLAAVGDLWTAEEFSARVDAESVRVIWHDRPPILAQPQRH